MKLKPVNEQVVVVFGASSGIGRAAALQFADRGARVVAAARGEEGLDSLVREIRGKGGDALAVPADATDAEQVRHVAERAVKQYGRLDTWAHIAAVTIYARVEDTSPDEFRHILDVNLIGQFNGIKAALPHLKRHGGALICVSSVESEITLPFQAAYAASKHGLHALVEALRMELRKDGAPVSVTEIKPASINTPLFTNARTKIGVKPMGLPPIYPPEMVAAAIVHAAQHAERDVIVGGSGKMMVLSKRAAPGLTDALLTLIGFRGQMTSERKSAADRDNLYRPVTDPRVEGDFVKHQMLEAAAPWLQRNRWAVYAGAAGAAFLAVRALRSR